MKEVTLKSSTTLLAKLHIMQEKGNPFLKNLSDRQLDEIVRTYKRFLVIQANYSDQNLVATEEIAFVWKLHSEMKGYERYCIKQFGKLITKQKLSELRKREKNLLQKDFVETKSLYEAEFGLPYEGEMSMYHTLEYEYVLEERDSLF